MNVGGPTGHLIDGRFELLERLGGGGMGLVWRARDTMLQREVALKEVRPSDALGHEDPGAAHIMRERVLREARSLARLHHANVVTIYHIVDDPGLRHPWLVMELVTGGSLQDRLDHGPLPPHEVAHVGRGVLAALSAAHAAGIHHRDVKPANVLLRIDGTPVLTDFGIAGLRESTATNLTATGALIGSPEYIAPERIRGQEGDPASDLWSLGMMMYVAAEGVNPLRRDNTLATIAAVLDAPIPQPLRCGPLTPVLGALLMRDPAARPDAVRLDQMLAAAEQQSAAAAYGVMPPEFPSPGFHSRPPSPYGAPSRTGSHAKPSAGFGPASSGTGSHAKPAPMYGEAAPDGLAPPIEYGTTPYGPYDSSLDDVEISDAASTAERRRTRPARSAAFRIRLTTFGTIGLSTATLLFAIHPWSSNTSIGTGSPDLAPITNYSQGSPSAGTNSGTGGKTVAAPSGNLLTPANVRGLISVIKNYTGGSQIVTMTVMADQATIEYPLKSKPNYYNRVFYLRGHLTNDTVGGTINTTTDAAFDPSVMDWEALPGLITYAKTHVNLANPTSIYVITQGKSVFEPGAGPVMLVYATDDYGGGGYIVANAKGKVIDTVAGN
jgi:serine/threonine protein kinase